MDAIKSNSNYKDRSRLFTVIGALLFSGGIAVGFLGPLEMYTFYLFTEGGIFHYEGFGFGSFMFGNITSQIIGYYLIAIMFILLGYGHLKKRRWIRTVSLTVLWSWMVVGAPLTILVFFILVASKDLPLSVALIALVFLGLSYLVFPAMLIRFYKSNNVTQTLETKDAKEYWIDDLPIPILVLSSLYLFYIIMLHILIMFNGLFPVFGVFRFGFQGIVLLDFSIWCLVCITWGTLQRRQWAWWSSIIFLGMFTFSTVLTFFRSSFSDILNGLAFPPTELGFLEGLPLQGYHFSVLVGIPLITTWVVTLVSKRHFRNGVRI